MPLFSTCKDLQSKRIFQHLMKLPNAFRSYEICPLDAMIEIGYSSGIFVGPNTSQLAVGNPKLHILNIPMNVLLPNYNFK